MYMDGHSYIKIFPSTAQRNIFMHLNAIIDKISLDYFFATEPKPAPKLKIG